MTTWCFLLFNLISPHQPNPRSDSTFNIFHNPKPNLTFSRLLHSSQDISIEKHYALKEILIQGESAHGLSITNEYDILKTLHSRCSESEETSGHVMGICDVPDIIHELVRLNLISPLCQMDLFSCIQHHYDLTRVDSFSTKVRRSRDRSDKTRALILGGDRKPLLKPCEALHTLTLHFYHPFIVGGHQPFLPDALDLAQPE